MVDDPKLLFQRIYAEDLEKVIAFLQNPSQKQVDIRLDHPSNLLVDFTLGIRETAIPLENLPDTLSVFPAHLLDKISFDGKK